MTHQSHLYAFLLLSLSLQSSLPLSTRSLRFPSLARASDSVRLRSEAEIMERACERLERGSERHAFSPSEMRIRNGNGKKTKKNSSNDAEREREAAV